MFSLTAVKSTCGYLTLIISFQLLQYENRDVKVCQSSALGSFNFTKSWDKVIEILLCSNFYVLQVSGKHNFIAPDTPWKPKRIYFSKIPNIFMLGKSSHYLIHVSLKHCSEIFSKII